MASQRKADPVAAARDQLRATEKLVGDLEAQRRGALVGDDDGLVQRLSARLETLYKQRQIDIDRLAAREAEAERQAAEKASKERLLLIGRVENRLRERDRIGAELAQHIAAADAAFCKLVEVNRQIHSAWEWSASDVFATMIADGALLAATRNEIFRVGGRVAVTGGEIDTRPPTYPGGEPERLEFLYAPQRSAALVDKLRDASATAHKIMRTGKNDLPDEPLPVAMVTTTPAPEPAAPVTNGHASPEAPPPKPAPAPNPERDRLLERQNELALLDTPEAEAEYITNNTRIAALS